MRMVLRDALYTVGTGLVLGAPLAFWADLHSSMAKMLRDYMGKRTHEKWASKTSLLFNSRNGKPLHQSNVLRRKLHPVLAALGQPKCGVHAFRRFRNTYLRNFTATPPGLLQFWMGHAGEGMSDLYDKIKLNVALRKKVAEQAGLASITSGHPSPAPAAPDPLQPPVLFLQLWRSRRVSLTSSPRTSLSSGRT